MEHERGRHAGRVIESDPSGLFTGRLALDSIGVVGHSFGGATAAQFCHDDERCVAGMDLDGACSAASFGLSPRAGVALTTRNVREFFDARLRKDPGVALQPGSLLPGVRSESR